MGQSDVAVVALDGASDVGDEPESCQLVASPPSVGAGAEGGHAVVRRHAGDLPRRDVTFQVAEVGNGETPPREEGGQLSFDVRFGVLGSPTAN